MVVAQDAAPHNGQIRVGPQEVVGELRDEVQQIAKDLFVNPHGDVFPVQDNAVFVVVDVGAVLQEEVGPVEAQGKDAVILPGGVAQVSGVALVLRAQEALGIARALGLSGGGNGLGVLLRLGEVDGNVQYTIFRLRCPPLILQNSIPADVIRVPGEGIVPVRRLSGRTGVPLPEGADDLRRPGQEDAHQFGVQQVEVVGGVAVQDAPAERVRAQGLQRLVQGGQGLRQVRGKPAEAVQFQGFQQTVGGPDPVLLRNPALPDRVLHQTGKFKFHGRFPPLRPSGSSRPQGGYR